ncbi:hypothetical protein IJ182_04645 [bacterium]|nr:hypothetical protein [bacterium]
MQNISFGKIVKVNAPENQIKKVTEIANAKKRHKIIEFFTSTKLKRDVNDLFDDIEKGKAVIVSTAKGDNFIFSGDESKKFSEIHNRYKEQQESSTYYNGTYASGLLAQMAKETYNNSISDLISNSGISSEITIDYDTEYDEVKSIDIVG